MHLSRPETALAVKLVIRFLFREADTLTKALRELEEYFGEIDLLTAPGLSHTQTITTAKWEREVFGG